MKTIGLLGGTGWSSTMWNYNCVRRSLTAPCEAGGEAWGGEDGCKAAVDFALNDE